MKHEKELSHHLTGNQGIRKTVPAREKDVCGVGSAGDRKLEIQSQIS